MTAIVPHMYDTPIPSPLTLTQEETLAAYVALDQEMVRLLLREVALASAITTVGPFGTVSTVTPEQHANLTIAVAQQFSDFLDRY